MVVPRARLLDLMKARCNIFATTFNPDGLRLGNKILRKRLRGPALASYYPRKQWSVGDMNLKFGPHVETYEEDDVDREEHIEERHLRGKKAPLKVRGPKDVRKKKK